jgi:hypothetical protein
VSKEKKPDLIAKALGEAYKILEQDRIREMAKEVEAKRPKKKEDYVQRDLLRGKVKTWERYLAADVAEANGCGVFYDPEEGLLEVYGRKQDLDIVENLYRFVYSQVVDATNKFFKKGEKKDRKALGAFRLGVVDAVAEEFERAHGKAAEALKDVDREIVDKAVEKLSTVLEDVLAWGEGQVEAPEEEYMQPQHESFKEGRMAGRNLDIESKGNGAS